MLALRHRRAEQLLWIPPSEKEWRKIECDMIVEYLKKDKKLAKMVQDYLNSIGRIESP